ncbi:MAG: dihydropyrimidinase [Candidatus Eremiobacterota bacterium]
MRILIKNGEVVTASDQFKADVLIDGEKVQAVGRNLQATADREYDATGHYVMPGGLDVHVHLAMPFMGTTSKDDFFTGSRAAIAGGTTSFIDFCIPSKGSSLKQALETWDAKCGIACCDFSYHMAIVDWNESIMKELDLAFEHGITSYKVFTAYKGALMLTDEEIFRLMLEVRVRGGLVTAHAVNGDVLNVLAAKFGSEGKLTPHYHPLCQPGFAEGEATGRILELGYLADQPAYIVHMTAKEAVEELIRARSRGWASFGECCPQHLTLDDSLYDLPDFEGAKYVMSPPLRKKEDQTALWHALVNDIIQVVGTDHCTFDFKGQKDMGKDDFRKIPNGLNGIEERINVLFTHGVKKGRISMSRLVELCCTNPAKLFGLYPQKGHLSPGADADVVVYDPNKKGTISARTHHSACDTNVYEGMALEGAPSLVFVRGKLSFEKGKFCGEKGFGRYLKRPAGRPMLAGVAT